MQQVWTNGWRCRGCSGWTAGLVWGCLVWDRAGPAGRKILKLASQEIAGQCKSGWVTARECGQGHRGALFSRQRRAPAPCPPDGITCRDGDPAVTLLWPCRGQDSPNTPGPPRQGTKPLAVKARNRAARLRALCPSCQPLPTHGQRSAEAVGEAGRLSQAPRERPARPPCSARKARGLRFRLPGPRDVTSAGPGRALRACARPRGLPACLAGSWSGVALALCAEVTPATPPAQPAARPTRALQHGHGVDLPDGRAVAWSSPAHAGLGPSETLCRGV